MSVILLASFGSNLSVFHEKIRIKNTKKCVKFYSFFFDLEVKNTRVSPLTLIFCRLRSIFEPKIN